MPAPPGRSAATCSPPRSPRSPSPPAATTRFRCSPASGRDRRRRVTLAATDRYRLAVRELQWQPERRRHLGVALVPARTLAETAKALTGRAQVSVALSTGDDAGAGRGLIGFAAAPRSARRRTTTRLLDGEFRRSTARCCPTPSPHHAQVETAALVEAVKRVSLVAPRNTPVRTAFTADQVLLEAGGRQEAQASEHSTRCSRAPTAVRTSRSRSTRRTCSTVCRRSTPRLTAVGVHQQPDQAGDPARSPARSRRAPAPEEIDYRYLLMPVRLSG